MDGNPGSLQQPFQTIPVAISRVSSGNVTSSTTFIFPGIYTGENDIYSNKTGQYMVFQPYYKTNYPVINGFTPGYTYEYGFTLNNVSKIIISHLLFTGYLYNSSYSYVSAIFDIVNLFACSNIIFKNNQFVNDYWCVFLEGSPPMLNYSIYSNTFTQAGNIGIYSYYPSACNNLNINRNLFDNDGFGIYLGGTTDKFQNY